MVVSLLQHLFILLTGKQCVENKPELLIKGKAVWKTPASVTNAAVTKAWCGQRERTTTERCPKELDSVPDPLAEENLHRNRSLLE